MDQNPDDAADAELQDGPTSDQITLGPGPGEEDGTPATPPEPAAGTVDLGVTGDLDSGADPA